MIVSAIYCEVIKTIHSKVFWLSFVLFALSLGMMSFGIEPRSWKIFFDRFFTLAANMGLIGNFFIASWVFGREFIDKTNKDLVAKPMSRETVVLSKFSVIAIWGIVFAAFLLIFSLAMGALLRFTGFTFALLSEALLKYIITSILYIFISTPGAFFASVSRGILAPIGVLFVLAIAANILNNTSAAAFFPWTIPSVFREAEHINPFSVVILILTGLAGIAGTFAWWRFAEQE